MSGSAVDWDALRNLSPSDPGDEARLCAWCETVIPEGAYCSTACRKAAASDRDDYMPHWLWEEV